MNENWYVLAVAVLRKEVYTIEQAFECYEAGKINKRAKMKNEDLEDAIKLKKQMTYVELGKIYGRTDTGICHLITKYKEGKYDR
ncbi:hypothetical protein FCV24_12790 [Clostridium botulinum]|uniref:hypothetical protein n=1 Tax=Clostridium botulinum TaxID=1491 RepID=UPI0005F93944|nr:hypothetical protein [Clostridium botulinum]MBY6800153.1 hypothetical protein [Clostridium botulinum]NFF20625.1 hypothetical protein [Clostridium botulinum]NFM74768.1 hypothetical protein [Clostridium botulinum]NFP79389.1 hypothetical protein [Clostridium botulinum]NFP93552.1 hypothetical protein [Clostridium botulinum]